MKLFVVLLAVVGMAFASSTMTGEVAGAARFFIPETDDNLDSYAYNEAEQMGSIPASFGDYAIVDDFNAPTDGAELTSYVGWGVTTASSPTSLNLLVVADNAGAPDGEPVSQNAYTTTCGNSGYTYGGYTIWVATMDLTGSPAVSTPCWLGQQRSGSDTWYPVCGTTVTGSEGYRTLAAGWAWEPFSNSLEAGDIFKVIEGTWDALSRDTWGAIKSNF